MTAAESKAVVRPDNKAKTPAKSKLFLTLAFWPTFAHEVFYAMFCTNAQAPLTAAHAQFQ
ncbi:MAG: hypothetical protein ACI9V0_002716 [Parasphingorhabdus sp.]|jgi:hypothetical protein